MRAAAFIVFYLGAAALAGADHGCEPAAYPEIDVAGRYYVDLECYQPGC